MNSGRVGGALLCGLVVAAMATGLTACGDDGDGCPPFSFEHGGDGHADPLSAAAGEVRAGRLEAGDIPASERGLEQWQAGDFVLANDRVAIVIEDAGPSNLYDPWGGRPVGFARIEGGALVEPSEFGEIFILAGIFTVFTDQVSVIADGSEGGPAVVRATGQPMSIPFITPLLSTLFNFDLADTYMAIDYSLAADSNQVEVFLRFRSQRDEDVTIEPVLHAFMFTERLDVYSPGAGFGSEGKPADFLVLVDDDATSIGYQVPGQRLQGGVGQSGFVSNFADSYDVAACAETEVPHAVLTIGGPGLQGVLQAKAEAEGSALRTISGVVRDAGGNPRAGARVHALSAAGDYLTRSARTGDDGAYSLIVDAAESVELVPFLRGYSIPEPTPAGADTVDLSLPATGLVHVSASELNGPAALPVKVQLLPTDQDETSFTPPRSFGEPDIPGGRLHVEYAVSGDVTVEVPVGSWDVVVSRGYEYAIHQETVEVVADTTVDVAATLERVVDTTGFMCADFHIHTYRSPDSGDDSRIKLMSAIADGLEIPVRSDHEWVNSFDAEVAELGMQDWAFAVGSVELTSFEAWGHMGVFPLTADPTLRNNGTPAWIEYPNIDQPEAPVEIIPPLEVFEGLRARPEEPVIIINHPRGGLNYFSYVGLDPATGLVDNEADWDQEFRLVEIFNESGWTSNLDGTVADWLALLDTGRRIFAVGSSDSHGIATSPTGYPRTCLDVGVDAPADLSANMVRDAAYGGHSVISGGVFVRASVGGAGPGEDASGTTLDIEVQAPLWVPGIDTMDVLVDGQVVHSVVLDPESPDVIRYQDSLTITPATGGSHVIVAVYSGTGASLAPVHPGRRPFGVSNPIFVTP